jgi:hypothetical protein
VGAGVTDGDIDDRFLPLGVDLPEEGARLMAMAQRRATRPAPVELGPRDP